MSETKRILADVVLGEDPEGYEEHLVTEVWYARGGTSMFSGNDESRGYYVAVRLEGRKNGLTRFTLFTGGVKRLIAGAKRFSASGLANAAPDPALVAGMEATMRGKHAAEVAKRAERAARRAG